MKQIPLTQGQYAFVDDEDYEILNKWKWQAQKTYFSFYAVRTLNSPGRKPSLIRMHRSVLGLKRGEFGDHRDRNGLNNQKYNLRRCTFAENCRNKRLRKDNRSGFIGVGLFDTFEEVTQAKPSPSI